MSLCPERLIGRYLLHDFVDEATGEVLVSKDKLMDDHDADIIVSRGVEKIEIRSILDCTAKHGICKMLRCQLGKRKTS